MSNSSYQGSNETIPAWISGNNDDESTNIPLPPPRPLLIEYRRCGICGEQLQIYHSSVGVDHTECSCTTSEISGKPGPASVLVPTSRGHELLSQASTPASAPASRGPESQIRCCSLCGCRMRIIYSNGRRERRCSCE